MFTTAMEEAPSSFWSLPNDIILNVLARVPRRYHPILSRVSKKLQSIIRSSELHKTRSLLGKDCFYVCMKESFLPPLAYHWFTLTEDLRLVSIPFSSPPEQFSAPLIVGEEIYFVGRGYYINPSKSMWIQDTRSGKLRQGPSKLVASSYSAMGLVDEKIYIFGGHEEKEIQAQVFDLKTQTWGVAVNPSVETQSTWMSTISPSLDRKIYAKNSNAKVIVVYDYRDGNCEIIKLPDNQFHDNNVCVIDNALYFHSRKVGLMWYNSKKREWSVVSGLKFSEYFLDVSGVYVVMAEYNLKLAFLWHDKRKMEIWCSMIALRPSGVEEEVQGRVEWSSCLLSKVPRTYRIMHCVGRTD